MRKIDALKKLAVKLGLASAVSDVTGTTNSEVIDFMATKIKNVMEVPQEMLIKSSTAESTKVFKITVVDNGTISATEVKMKKICNERKYRLLLKKLL